jgi:glycosyltransferase involved in cell wall biosynthesis
MRLSIIVPVLNSHEILRRQMLHFERIGIPDDTEIIIVDDGSEPPLEYKGALPVIIYATNDKRPWTWALARNAGARIARGVNLLMFDVDHIVTREIIDIARYFSGSKIEFDREFAVLKEDGSFTQSLDVLMAYGFPKSRVADRGLTFPPLPNNFVMSKDLFWELGGYREDLVARVYPQGEDRLFKKAWYNWCRKTGNTADDNRPVIYMFPNGKPCGDVDFNPFGLFHKLSRKTNRNFWYKKQGSKNG